MEIPNAFIGKTSAPTVDEVVAALGPTSEVWKQLIDWMAEQGATVQEWNSYSAKVKKRNIVYLAPCSGCFRVAFTLGDRAVAAARQSNLSKSNLKLLDEAPKYPEGTGVRLIVKAPKDLAAIRKLALIKLAN